MHFPMRIQPVDSIRNDAVKPPPVLKSRLKRLFDRPFNGVLRISSAEKAVAGGEKDGVATAAAAAEFEPSSVCLDKMVQNFIEDNNNNEKQSTAKHGRNRCNCFNGNSIDSSDDELDFFSDSLTANSSFTDPSDTLKSLIPCASTAERNLLADTSKIVEKNRGKRKDDLRNIVTDSLIALGYNASVCKSKWEKSSSTSIPAGEYEYIDVIIDGERVLIDVDFRSEFEIARSTSSYKAILQCLPSIFVGKSDRLLQIVSVASEAVRQSLKKKGMHIAPWRKSEYMKSKWLSPHTRRLTRNDAVEVEEVLECEVGELDLIFGERISPEESNSGESESPATEIQPEKCNSEEVTPPAKSDFEESISAVKEVVPAMTWQLPAVRPKSLERGNKRPVTGLASLLKEKL
ncbi:hypothetical protein BUALT_Bualt14G0103100 [Buddleja alternifolia]|uniref:Uncharacterized protein n=1 Tax=Buddleja alternifolia TaxID=168488 RepID=A0AAV6WTJ6_9LAMI|nr:hypothetical protein BUALT_Bualt14G0103100 [Buddleja alternifolia]